MKHQTECLEDLECVRTGEKAEYSVNAKALDCDQSASQFHSPNRKCPSNVDSQRLFFVNESKACDMLKRLENILIESWKMPGGL